MLRRTRFNVKAAFDWRNESPKPLRSASTALVTEAMFALASAAYASNAFLSLSRCSVAVSTWLPRLRATCRLRNEVRETKYRQFLEHQKRIIWDETDIFQLSVRLVPTPRLLSPSHSLVLSTTLLTRLKYHPFTFVPFFFIIFFLLLNLFSRLVCFLYIPSFPLLLAPFQTFHFSGANLSLLEQQRGLVCNGVDQAHQFAVC